MKYLLLLLIFWCVFVRAESNSLNLNIPNTSRTFQQDRIRSSDGVDCSMAIGSGTTVEFGVVGIISDENPYNTYGQPLNIDPENLTKDVGVYGKISIPIGAPKERINCNKLYKLEIERKELELQKLRQEIVNLKELQFEN